MYRLTFELDGLPPLLSQQRAMHWRRVKRISDQWRQMVGFKLAGKMPTLPLERASVRYTRYSAAEPDWDNLAASWKPIQDTLVKSGLLKDDNPRVIINVESNWEKIAPREGKIRVEVTELENPFPPA